MIEVLTFIKPAEETDEHGDPKITETTREVLATLASVGQKEFYEAHAVGLKPEMKFILADYLDYDGEDLLEHGGVRYRVLRTYRNGQRLEITVYREVNPA